MQKFLKTYLRRLTNLTSRNRSLLLLNLPQEQFFDLHQLDFLDGKPSFEYINQLIAQKNTVPLCDILDSRFEKVNEASKILRKIARTETFIEQERGAKDLYVGYPFVKGKLSDGMVVRCPLLFFPVTLKLVGKKWVLEKRDEAISLNRSFLLAYSHFNQVSISDEFLETSFEDAERQPFDKDSLVFRTQLYELLKQSSIEINFNQDNFTNQLIDYQRLTKSDLELSERNGELKLYPQAVLGIFPQAGSFLVPDYEELIAAPAAPPVEASNRPDGGAFLNSPVANLKVSENEFLAPPLGAGGAAGAVREESTFLPFAVDASQEAAVRHVKSGESLVVQGPPGTGKSQLIANLVADFTARGKRVLVVCQKRVALDTVFRRLEKANMTDFVALVHDFKNDRKILFEKIANQIDKTEDYQKQNKGLDAIFLERNFTQISRRIDKLSEELDEFKKALFDESICGLSVKEMYLMSSRTKPFVALEEGYKSFIFNDLTDFLGRMKRYFQYEVKFRESDDYEFWKDRISFAKFTDADIPKITKAISEVRVFEATNTTGFSVVELNGFDERIVSDFIECFSDDKVIGIFKKINAGRVQNPASVSIVSFLSINLKKLNAEIENLFANNWIESNISEQELILKKTQTEKALIASKSGLNWFAWKLFSKDKKELEKLLFENKLTLQTTDLELLIRKIDNRIVFENIKMQLAKKGILIDAKEGFDLISKNLKNYILANQANTIYQANVFLQKPDFSVEYYHYLKQTIIEVKQKMVDWKRHISEKQFESFFLNETSDRAGWEGLFDDLVEADILRESFTKTELSVVEKLVEMPENAVEVFQNSLRLAWVQHIENLYPILRSVSSLKMQQMEDELQECMVQKQALSQEIVGLKLREQTYKDLIINRLQNTVSYRELQYQTTKKRKLWSVRKLLAAYSDEIFKLVPCWMASPESVSAMFVLDNNLFDLVIFDEASQCFAEYGIPAMCRGKQVVVAGDSKQLQPNDLYQVRYEDDQSNEPILEIDSLLDLAAQYLPQTSLMGHYRSQSLDLIEFSNQHFYKKSLRLLPHYQQVSRNEPAIDYIKVAGIWSNNTNEAEAQKVCEIIENLQKDSPEKSIGVVTFNARQAELIEKFTIYDLGFTHDLNNRISIKNIENIQGDEFDIVIFSVAYAPDIQGRMLMNFGSLNQVGGENRLNVAITRAREKIFVVSSILPDQLNVENAQNEGPKLLKKYLSYALEISEKRYVMQHNLPEGFSTNWFLKEQLKNGNSLFSSELPFADITVKDENGAYESLILTDDDLYFGSLSAKETHAYLPINLRDKGWKFERIWSRTSASLSHR